MTLACRFFALLARAYVVWLGTLKVSIVMPDGTVLAPEQFAFGRQLFAICERDLLVLARMVRHTPFTALVALGRDGDWATAAGEALGCTIVRGSSRRGGSEALAELVKALDASPRPTALVVDGPLGPAGVPKGGALFCGGRTGRPVIPVGAAARRAIVFRSSWSGIFLPLPFTRAAFVCGEPIVLERPPRRGESASLLATLGERLALARKGALAAVGRPEAG